MKKNKTVMKYKTFRSKKTKQWFWWHDGAMTYFKSNKGPELFPLNTDICFDDFCIKYRKDIEEIHFDVIQK